MPRSWDLRRDWTLLRDLSWFSTATPASGELTTPPAPSSGRFREPPVFPFLLGERRCYPEARPASSELSMAACSISPAIAVLPKFLLLWPMIVKWKFDIMLLTSNGLREQIREAREAQIIGRNASSSLKSLRQKFRALEVAHKVCAEKLKARKVDWNRQIKRVTNEMDGCLLKLNDKDEEIRVLKEELEYSHCSVIQSIMKNEEISVVNMILESKFMEICSDIKGYELEAMTCVHSDSTRGRGVRPGPSSIRLCLMILCFFLRAWLGLCHLYKALFGVAFSRRWREQTPPDSGKTSGLWWRLLSQIGRKSPHLPRFQSRLPPSGPNPPFPAAGCSRRRPTQQSLRIQPSKLLLEWEKSVDKQGLREQIREAREAQIIGRNASSSLKSLRQKFRALEVAHKVCAEKLKARKVDWTRQIKRVTNEMDGCLLKLNDKDEEIRVLKEELEYSHCSVIQSIMKNEEISVVNMILESKFMEICSDIKGYELEVELSNERAAFLTEHVVDLVAGEGDDLCSQRLHKRERSPSRPFFYPPMLNDSMFFFEGLAWVMPFVQGGARLTTGSTATSGTGDDWCDSKTKRRHAWCRTSAAKTNSLARGGIMASDQGF
ncbi:hypothetical protein KSP40_PGU005197 [Platanthera guangdongensis]|uniref:Uncharacterized protein n=1 Tax=Platanthera guangdongensis TaxID=2320717 RepID=A0ABR2MZC2_9ASPA